MVSQLDVFNFHAVLFGEQLAHGRIRNGTRSRQVVDLVAVWLLVQQDHDGGVRHIVGRHIIDSHTVTGRDKLVVFAQQFSLHDQGRRHEMRTTQNRIRNTRIVLGRLQQVVTGSVKVDKGHRLSVLTGRGGNALPFVGGPQKGDLDKVFDLLFFAGFNKGGKDIGPSLDVREGAKDGFDAIQSTLEIYKRRGVKEYIFV